MSRRSTTTSSTDQLDLVDIKPGKQFSLATLRSLLPDVETALFFGKVYNLDAQELGTLLHNVFRTSLTAALFTGSDEHSTMLQDYLLDGYYDEDGDWYAPIANTPAEKGAIKLGAVSPKGEILPEVWKQLEVTVAKSIKDVAIKLESVIGMLPGKKADMLFRSMSVMNKRRPTIGDHQAQIHHAPQKQNLVILDDSGSVNEHTVRTIINDVVALCYMANAHFCLISNTARYWEPGTFDVDTVMAVTQYGGTQYQNLADVLARDWGTVVTIADYDSSQSAKVRVGQCTGRIDEVLDISLVNRPTFLAECVGQLATTTRPILIGSSAYVLT